MDHEQLFDFNKTMSIKHKIFNKTVFYKIAPATTKSMSLEDYESKIAELSFILSL